MKKPFLIFTLFLASGCAAKPELSTPPALAPASTGASQWVQLGEGGAAELRAVMQTPGGVCPKFSLPGGGELTMSLRAPASDAFPALCSAPLPKGVNISGVPTINLDPQRIVVLGDTGCRLENNVTQNCNNPRDWPFPSVAASAARLKPDLVIDVGDYLYRQAPCPAGNAGCAGAPYGDNWPAWTADFFAPAAPLLNAAPWIFVRGNHESCLSMGRGFLRLMGPKAVAPDCAGHLAPYHIPLSGLDLMVMDNADADDVKVDADKTPVYRAELEEAVRPSAVPVWLLMHRPIWAAMTGPLNVPIGGNAQIIAAAEKTMLTKPVTLMLAGHLHAFEVINYQHNGVVGTPPPQLMAGNGGDVLLSTPADLKGAAFQGHSGVSVKDGLSVGGFGFLLLTKSATGWTIDLYDSAGVAEGQCLFTAASDRLDCPKLPGTR